MSDLHLTFLIIEHCLEIFPRNFIFFFHQLFQGSSDGEMRGHIQPADYSATTLGIGQEKYLPFEYYVSTLGGYVSRLLTVIALSGKLKKKD